MRINGNDVSFTRLLHNKVLVWGTLAGALIAIITLVPAVKALLPVAFKDQVQALESFVRDEAKERRQNTLDRLDTMLIRRGDALRRAKRDRDFKRAEDLEKSIKRIERQIKKWEIQERKRGS